MSGQIVHPMPIGRAQGGQNLWHVLDFSGTHILPYKKNHLI